LAVFVIPPAQVKNLRGRYNSAGNKDDRFDAYVLADVVRTDRRRLRALSRDSRQTAVLRSLVRARRNLVAHRVAVANQLRAHLQIAFPGGTVLFWDIDSGISLQFLERFPSQTRADWLSTKRLGAWLAAAGYSGRTNPGILHARLLDAPRGLPGADPAVHETHAQITLCFVAVLRSLQQQLHGLAARIGDELALHPDREIFTSLPRCGTLRAARMLVEIGDARGRYPTPESLICHAGVAPSTRQSGKAKIVTFRWSADRQLRDAVCDFADGSRHANPWAAQLYARARARGCDHPHAIRILARAWLQVIWRTWQDRTSYQPEQHAALQAVLSSQQQGEVRSGG
jgi:transposase